uniref:Uncharacterized protein n=1 Tax=Caenorhabditis japonica TaxID=281687 RepID=A0A8R1EKX6_CAEJA
MFETCVFHRVVSEAPPLSPVCIETPHCCFTCNDSRCLRFFRSSDNKEDYKVEEGTADHGVLRPRPTGGAPF